MSMFRTIDFPRSKPCRECICKPAKNRLLFKTGDHWNSISVTLRSAKTTNILSTHAHTLTLLVSGLRSQYSTCKKQTNRQKSFPVSVPQYRNDIPFSELGMLLPFTASNNPFKPSYLKGVCVRTR